MIFLFTTLAVACLLAVAFSALAIIGWFASDAGEPAGLLFTLFAILSLAGGGLASSVWQLVSMVTQ